MGAASVGCNGTAGLKFESGTGNGGGVTVGVKWVGAGNTHVFVSIIEPSRPGFEYCVGSPIRLCGTEKLAGWVAFPFGIAKFGGGDPLARLVC